MQRVLKRLTILLTALGVLLFGVPLAGAEAPAPPSQKPDVEKIKKAKKKKRKRKTRKKTKKAKQNAAKKKAKKKAKKNAADKGDRGGMDPNKGGDKTQ